MPINKYKLKGKQLIKRIERESWTLDGLIDDLIFLRKTYYEDKRYLPVPVHVLITNAEGDIQYRAKLKTMFVFENDVTLIGESENPRVES